MAAARHQRASGRGSTTTVLLQYYTRAAEAAAKCALLVLVYHAPARCFSTGAAGARAPTVVVVRT